MVIGEKMDVKLPIPDKLKEINNSFDECLTTDGYYNIMLVNWINLTNDNVIIPKHIVKECDLQKNLMIVDDGDLHLIEVLGA